MYLYLCDKNLDTLYIQYIIHRMHKGNIEVSSYYLIHHNTT